MRALLVIVMIARTAGAQAPPDAPDDPVHRADEAMHRGIDATKAGDHTAALAAFLEAAGLVPDANLPHRLAGEALEALDRPAEAIAEYQRYIEIKPDASGVAEVRARITRLETRLTGDVKVRCGIPDATVMIDGHPAGAPPLTATLPPHTVTIEIIAPGYLPQRAQIEIIGGHASELECELAHKEVAIAPITPPRSHSSTPWYRRWSVILPVVGVAVVSAGIGAFAAFGSSVPSSDGGAHRFP